VPYYLAPYIGKGTMLEPFQPLGSDQPGWAAIDLRPDGGATLGGNGLNLCFLYLPQPNTDTKLIKIGENKLDTIGSLLKQIIISKLNLIELNYNQFNEIVASVMINPPINGWKALRPTKNMYELYLGEKIWEMPVIKGGASFSENWNCADSASLTCNLTWTEILGTVWGIVTNRARASGITNAVARADSDVSTDDHEVSATLVTKTYVTSGIIIALVLARKDSTTTRTYYTFDFRQYSTTNEFHRLTKIIAGNDTQLGTDALDDYSANEIIKVKCDGSSIGGFINGVSKVGPITDTAIVGNFRGGIQYYGDTNAGHLVEFDDWNIADLVSSGFWGPLLGLQNNRLIQEQR